MKYIILLIITVMFFISINLFIKNNKTKEYNAKNNIPITILFIICCFFEIIIISNEYFDYDIVGTSKETYRECHGLASYVDEYGNFVDSCETKNIYYVVPKTGTFFSLLIIEIIMISGFWFLAKERLKNNLKNKKSGLMAYNVLLCFITIILLYLFLIFIFEYQINKFNHFTYLKHFNIKSLILIFTPSLILLLDELKDKYNIIIKIK